VLQGDLNHWVDLMNRFDDVLERTAAALDPVVDGADAAATEPQPPSPELAALTVQALRVTHILLENCNNKHRTTLLRRQHFEWLGARRRAMRLIHRDES
jgi:hypothetical protein